MPPRFLGAAGVALLALAAPAGAGAAPTLAPLKPCYVTVGEEPKDREAVGIRAAGFTPNTIVDLAVDGIVVSPDAGLQTNATGALDLPSNSVPAPYVERGRRKFTVTLTERHNPANRVSETALSTALGVSVRPRRARPASDVSFRGAGFTLDKPVYAHYIYRDKIRKRVRMAGRTGTCGTWKARRPQIPVRNPGTGTWVVQFQQGKRYFRPEQARSPYVRLEILVTLERRDR